MSPERIYRPRAAVEALAGEPIASVAALSRPCTPMPTTVRTDAAWMPWRTSHRFSREGCKLADRHYSRQKPGTPQFVATGKPLVLLAGDGANRALWVSLYQLPQYTKHAWPGAWSCTMFRNEGAGLASDLIRAAVAATRFAWGEPPAVGFITFVNPSKVRHKRDPGRCFMRAGFKLIGHLLKERKLVLQLEPGDMPPPRPAIGAQRALWSA